MGAWGTGIFDNDAAMDWCDEFIEAPEGEGDDETRGKLVLLLGPLQMAAEPEDEDGLDADDASAALAAAEVIAAIHGKPAKGLEDPEDDPGASLVSWIRGNSDEMLRRPEIRAIAAKAVAQVRDRSELAELWAESDDAEGWLAAVGDLQARLSS